MSLRGHFGHAGQSEVSENGPNEFAMPQNPGIYTKISFLACSEPKLQVWPCYGNLSGHKWPLWPLRSFWGFWKWSQRISHATKPGNRHQNHVSSMLRTKVTSLAFFMVIWVAINGRKLPFWPLGSFWVVWKWSQWISHAPKSGDRQPKSSFYHAQNQSYKFGHFMVIWVAMNGRKWPFWPRRSIWGVRKWSQWICHAPKPGDRHQNHVSSILRTKVTNLAILWTFEWP